MKGENSGPQAQDHNMNSCCEVVESCHRDSGETMIHTPDKKLSVAGFLQQKAARIACSHGPTHKQICAMDELGSMHSVHDVAHLCYLLHSPDFNGVDGILGFGLPKAGEEGRELPTPILFAMTDQENKESNARDLTRKFSFFSTDTDGKALLFLDMRAVRLAALHFQ